MLVVYYSRTGATKKIAEHIAKELNADIEEIIDQKNRKGILGYLRSGYEASRRKTTEIKDIRSKIPNYDIVIISTPVWSWNMSSPVRTVLMRYKFKRVALSCTMGGAGDKKAFAEMRILLLGAEVIAEASIQTKEVIKGNLTKMTDFCNKIKNLYK